MFAAVASATLNGAVGRAVSVEVYVSNGLPGFAIVGLPDAAVRKARDSVPHMRLDVSTTMRSKLVHAR